MRRWRSSRRDRRAGCRSACSIRAARNARSRQGVLVCRCRRILRPSHALRELIGVRPGSQTRGSRICGYSASFQAYLAGDTPFKYKLARAEPRDDLIAGMLTDLRQLVTAEAFGDLLEAAEHLIAEKHHLPAAALAGAILESSMRVLATNRNVGWTGASGISKLNQALYAANVYDKVFLARSKLGESVATKWITVTFTLQKMSIRAGSHVWLTEYADSFAVSMTRCALLTAARNRRNLATLGFAAEV